ncbi:hypothetical protein ACJYYY_04255 [Brochothrix campestris]|uniref:Uncharacterized protein n=1 Tax=Brochothrix campestris FSL F6-1037 TaxID=1265861 RepID=W7CTR6_9LIST|nr:hypothetical protein BCAMP_05501 [Brochothrix campestris FSL F6-1037]
MTKREGDKDKQAYAVIYHVSQFGTPTKGDMWFDGQLYRWQLIKKAEEWQVVVEDEKWRWWATEKKITRERLYAD